MRVALIIERSVRMVSVPLLHSHELEWALQRNGTYHHVQPDAKILGLLVRAGSGKLSYHKPIVSLEVPRWVECMHTSSYTVSASFEEALYNIRLDGCLHNRREHG